MINRSSSLGWALSSNIRRDFWSCILVNKFRFTVGLRLQLICGYRGSSFNWAVIVEASTLRPGGRFPATTLGCSSIGDSCRCQWGYSLKTRSAYWGWATFCARHVCLIVCHGDDWRWRFQKPSSGVGKVRDVVKHGRYPGYFKNNIHLPRRVLGTKWVNRNNSRYKIVNKLAQKDDQNVP